MEKSQGFEFGSLFCRPKLHIGTSILGFAEASYD
jgi:hypothetical protein